MDPRFPCLSRRLRAFVAAAAALFVLSLLPTAAHAAGLLIADGGLGGNLDIEEHDVKVVVNNGIVVTTVTQVFRNTENRQVEALYVFPVPKGASVSNFSMWIGGREMVGEVVEKERARQIYNSYKQVRRDPGLLEQADFRSFEMRIFPIGAKAEQRVQVTYCQELDFDHDWATYVYPLATSTRPGAKAQVKGKFALSLDVKSEIPIVSVESPSHGKQFVVAKHDERYTQASMEATGGDLGRDVVLAFHVARPHTGLDIVTSRAPGDDGYFCLTFTAGEELAAKDRGMDYVFVLDISGSMGDEGKLRISRESLGAFIKSLGVGDRFEIVAFNIQPKELFGALRAADDVSKAAGNQFLASQEAAGGTVLAPAITRAYKHKDADRPLNVVLMSDGLTEQGETTELMRLITVRPSGARVFCIGVGNDVNRPLLEQLAEEAGGLAAFVSRDDDFGRQAVAFRRKLTRPVAEHVRIAFEGVETYDVEPKNLPNLFYGAPVRLYGRYRGAGSAKVTVRADVGSAEIVQAVAVKLPERDDANPEIERMWASHRISALLREADRAGNRAAVAPEIVRLGEGYSIVTEFTSFLVLENDAEFQRWQIQRRNAVRLARDRRSQEQVSSELEGIRRKADVGIGPTEQARPEAPQPPNVVTPAGGSSPAGPRDVDFGNRPSSGGGSGGGAFDPITGGIALALGALAVAARKRKKHTPKNPDGASGDNL
ncbi:MAG: VIT and VWA domain-containing protein [Planctomycetes bacterium]|nr:VIT and VWA domain-containing protein [Planctomycetota bacterium]